MKRNLIAEVMAELCEYGGMLATRMEVYEHLRAQRGQAGEKLSAVALDRLTWMPPSVDKERADYLRDRGLVFAELTKEKAPAEAGAIHHR